MDHSSLMREKALDREYKILQRVHAKQHSVRRRIARLTQMLNDAHADLSSLVAEEQAAREHIERLENA